MLDRRIHHRKHCQSCQWHTRTPQGSCSMFAIATGPGWGHTKCLAWGAKCLTGAGHACAALPLVSLHAVVRVRDVDLSIRSVLIVHRPALHCNKGISTTQSCRRAGCQGQDDLFVNVMRMLMLRSTSRDENADVEIKPQRAFLAGGAGGAGSRHHVSSSNGTLITTLQLAVAGYPAADSAWHSNAVPPDVAAAKIPCPLLASELGCALPLCKE